MDISGPSSLLGTKETEGIVRIQAGRQERDTEVQSGLSSSPTTTFATIMEGMREISSRQAPEQGGGQSDTDSGLPGDTAADSSGAPSVKVTKDGVIEGLTANVLPEDIVMKSEQNLAKIIERGTKVLFEFGEDGSVSIKPGLFHEDYLRAQACLLQWEIHKPGLGLGLLSKQT